MKRRLLLAVPAAVAGALIALALSGDPVRAAPPRTVVLGFDGAAADRTEMLMAEGKLPNLAALAKRGGYSRLATSNPAQSPVSWASIATGWNPGKTGIYDFLKRVPTRHGVSIQIGLAEPVQRDVIPMWGRALLICGAGAVGAAAGVGVILALYAGERRAKRPKGLLQGTMTGVAAVFACAAYVVLAWVPTSVPYAKNLRSGEPFWVTLDRAGVRCVALEAPLSFPADEMSCGCCLSGLGVPDIQGTWGTFATWTNDPSTAAHTETGGVSWFVEPGTKKFDLVLPGPPNPRADPDAVAAAYKAADEEKYKREAAFHWTPMKRRASETAEDVLKLASQTTARIAVEIEMTKGAKLTTAEGVVVHLAPGVWSDLVPVVFTVSPIVKIHGRVRFLLESAGSAPTATGEPWIPFVLFAAPVQFDAGELPPNVQIASPMQFAKDLAHANGPFETIGWPELTNPVKDDLLADRDFLTHLNIIRKGREKRLFERLERTDWDVLFAMFSEPDRVQHAFWRHIDPKSPRHDPVAAKEFGPEIDRSYVEMDRLVGEVVAKCGPETRVLVISDHGFAPFRRGVNLNNLLCAGGLQVRSGNAGPKGVGDLIPGKEGVKVKAGGKFFEDVKWGETKAYAMGLGNLYLNLKGREVLGAVDPKDADKVLDTIEAQLYALRDKDGSKVVAKVYRGKDLYHGARAAEAPDIVVGFESGYRVSWQTALGSIDDDVITDNKFRWSGDHCSVDPSHCGGILFSSLPLSETATPGVVDVNPSVLSLYGLSGPDPDGRSFLAK